MPEEVLGETLLELRQQFGAVSAEAQLMRGLWQHEGRVFSDELVRVFVDVADVPASRQFFLELKERLKARFRQLDIWLTSHPIDVL